MLPPHHPSRAALVVLGDIERSPRMQYHALALAADGIDVDLVGYGSVPQGLRREPRICGHAIRPPRSATRPGWARPLFVLASLFRIVRQAIALASILIFKVARPDLILVQNPPAIPALLVALAAARLRSAQLVIDWHNLAFTMLALRLGSRSRLVRLSAWYEHALGQRADAHLCISRAMQRVLAERWGIEATVFHDRPHERFAPLSSEERDAMVARLCRDLAVTVHTRPALIVSPTSWTADEDFELLLEAMDRCEVELATRDAARPAYPTAPWLVVVTGRGPLRERFEDRFRRRAAERVHLRTLWLPSEEYPGVIAAADLGLCLHRSSSGVDLPMKVADLLGCSVPVCALDYGPCLAELVRPGENGVLFHNAAQLATRLLELLDGFPGRGGRLERLRAGALESAAIRWRDGWITEARPLLRAKGRDVRAA